MQQVVVFIIKVCSIRGVWRLCLTPIPSKWLLQFPGKSLPSESSGLADSTREVTKEELNSSRVGMAEKGLHFVNDTCGDFGQRLDFFVGPGDENEEEKLLKQAIALSLEGAVENDNEEKDNNEEDGQDDGEEEELLRQAIALSLEWAEENS